jgi:hypothetical protein
VKPARPAAPLTAAAAADAAAPAAPREPEGDGREELAPGYPPDTASLEVRAQAHVLSKPTDRARYIGKITRGTRVAFKRIVSPDPEEPGSKKSRRKPCPAWVEIVPRGYLCQDLLKPSTEPPSGVRQPVVRTGAFTPDGYFKVAADGTKVFKSRSN